MCGIVGIATKYANGFSKAETDTFTDLLFLDTMRGFDSTGVFGVDKHSNVDIHKAALHGLDFIRHEKFKEFKSFIQMKGVFAVGHNRAATRGSIVDKNAHPFWEQDKIVLVQNGTYRGNHKVLKDTEVDTEAIAHVLAEEPDVETALKKVNASYALAWFNTETHTLNLIRNTERPLWLLEAKNGSLVWASEPGFMYMAMRRQGMEWDKNVATEIPAHTLVSLTIDGNKWVREDKSLKCEYTFPKTDNGVWTGAANDLYESDDGWETYRQQQQGMRVPGWVGRQALPAPKRAADNREDVTLTMNQAVFDHYSDFHYKVNEGMAAVEAINGVSRDNKQIMEVIDYIAANDHTGCTTWHIMASFVQVDENNPAYKVVCHWFVYNSSEQEVAEYTKQPFYKGSIANTKLITYNDKVTVVTVFMNDIERMNVSQPIVMAH